MLPPILLFPEKPDQHPSDFKSRIRFRWGMSSLVRHPVWALNATLLCLSQAPGAVKVANCLEREPLQAQFIERHQTIGAYPQEPRIRCVSGARFRHSPAAWRMARASAMGIGKAISRVASRKSVERILIPVALLA